MKLFHKVRELDGHRKIYFCGIPILSYKKHVKTPDFTYHIMKYMGATHCDNLENLILGSSHGRDGFVPGKTDFNLSNSSLDLYRIWHLYKYVTKHNGKNLKNIIVFWSVFHAGLQLKKTREWRNTIPYKKLYDIDYAFPLPVNDSFFLDAIENQLCGFVCPSDFRGKSTYNVHHNESAQELAQKHIKNTLRNNNQIQYLDKIAKLARKKNHKLYVVLPPYRADYLNALPVDEVVYHELFDFLKNNTDVKLFNLQHDSDFTDDDFDSPDHCNENGGKKLTRKIRAAMRKRN
ncbi:MAG: hypothetical protein IKP05_01775 [Alphaproteobacteria bacterium]|nr:hypothetical protein [Alphaproteobacteria bacterium]